MADLVGLGNCSVVVLFLCDIMEIKEPRDRFGCGLSFLSPLLNSLLVVGINPDLFRCHTAFTLSTVSALIVCC